MKTLVLSNNELEVKDIENTLEALQKIVGGYIEIPFLSKIFYQNEIDIIINEEGKMIEGLKPEIAILENGSNKVLDVVMGNCLFASHDDEGNTVGLTDKQIEIVENELKMSGMLGNNIVRVLFI